MYSKKKNNKKKQQNPGTHSDKHSNTSIQIYHTQIPYLSEAPAALANTNGNKDCIQRINSQHKIPQYHIIDNTHKALQL